MRKILPFLLACVVGFASCTDDKPCDADAEKALDDREAALNQREADIAARERALGMNATNSSSQDGASSGTYNGTNASAGNNRANVVVNDPSNGRRTRKPTEVRTAYRKPNSSFPGQYPESSERLLTADDLVHTSTFGKKVMLNEIYARHGMIFTDPELKRHFAQESWYKGTMKNVDKLLTATERKNIAFISSN